MTTRSMAVRLLSVNVGLPGVIGMRGDEPVVSGIAKQPVAPGLRRLEVVGLEGDGQADLVNHGGRDKAVYAYPSEHLPAWSAELDMTCGPATFGENLTTEGVNEDDVCIGDTWVWGDAILEVAQPRFPCYKLALHVRRPDLPKRLVASGRTGWYLRVLRPGTVSPHDEVRILARHGAGVSVLTAHLAGLPGRLEPEAVDRVRDLAPLAEAWKRRLASAKLA
ncbi:MAG: MOSC domain-containing protein [Chloroflexota bacterium]|nr:MOSC domain-containing protein [Chloroflexota bacterium]